ncbi:MAG: hypothetical protein V7629_08260 [Motiliproteus sp.]
MMDILILVLVTALAGACGYLGGRWYAAYKQAKLQAKLESDSENFIRMLEERNQDYVIQKQQIDKSRQQSNETQTELNNALGRIEQEQEKYQLLQQQLDTLNEKQDRMRLHYTEMEAERQQFRDAKLTLEADIKPIRQQNLEMNSRNEQLEEKCTSVLVEKTRLQTDLVNKERELQDLRKRLIKQEDLSESTELTLDQMRSKHAEMAQQLAYSEGQLAALVSLKQTQQPSAELQQSEPQFKPEFI